MPCGRHAFRPTTTCWCSSTSSRSCSASAAADADEQAHDEAIAFVKLLLEGTAQQRLPIYVVLTMRSDFIGDCMDFRGLPEAVNAGLYPRRADDS